MNRKLYLGIMSFFAVVFIITFSFLPYYNPIYFYLQHISLFLFVAMLLYFLLQLGFNRLVKRIKKQSILRGYTIAVMVLALFGFSNLQLKFIELYQTSDFQFCEYYDQYNNSIYYTQYPNNCPELEILEKTDSSLSFVVYEETQGEAEREYMGLNNVNAYRFSAKTRTNIELEYDSRGNIVESTMQKSTNILLYNDEDEYKIYNSIITHMENQVLLEDGQPITFISKQSTGEMLDTFKDYNDFEVVEHYLDNQFDFEYIIFRSDKVESDINTETVEELYQIEISRNIYDNPEFSGEATKENIIQLLDFVCNEEKCTVRREDFNHNLAQYRLLQESNLIDFDSGNIMIISNNEIELVFPVYRYTESENHTGRTTYTNFKDYGLLFDSYELSYSSALNQYDVYKETFKYAGKYYIEHGKYYGVLYNTDYGLMIKTKKSVMEYEGGVVNPFIYASSDYFDSPYHRVIHNIYDYGNRAHYNPTDRDEILYQKNPLIFMLIEFQE